MTDSIQDLKHLLADSYTLALKTQNYHWNVSGPMFSSLHELFSQQYIELSVAIDDIAERIRALKSPAPGSYKEFLSLTRIKEVTEPQSWKSMVQDLLTSHESIAKNLSKELSEHEFDQATEDMFIARINVHDKASWMLRSILKD